MIMQILLIGATSTVAFNFAPDAAILFSDPLKDFESYFGYTVALQQDPSRVIVGAPRSHSSLPSHRYLTRPGAVFHCSLQNVTSRVCVQFTLEAAGDVKRVDEEYFDKKSDAWIGGTLDVSDLSPHMVACGSRWKNQIYEDYYLMNGVCYSLADSRHLQSEAQKLIPLLDRQHQSTSVSSHTEELFYYAYGQAGFSTHLTPSMDLIVGAPGVLLWTGTVIRFENKSSTKYDKPYVHNPFYTKDLTSGSYMGYAVGSGRFHVSEMLYVASAPRAAGYYGQVFVFQFPTARENPLDVRSKLRGFQMGEYFGAAIATVDVNSDGLDDLLVGAPLHSTNQASDMGVVYVYLNEQLWSDLTPSLLNGAAVSGARFGSAIGGLGDFDQDGYNDVVIGAPYEGQGPSMGAVYIYRGSALGVSQKPTQRIAASMFSPTLRGFGISISRAVDIDANHYPDLAVGAYDSGHVVVLRSSPVVHLRSRIDRSVRRIHLNTELLTFDVCFTYNGEYVPPYLRVVAEIAADKTHRRASFPSGGFMRSITFDLRTGVEECKAQILHLKNMSSWSASARYAALPIVVVGTLPPVPFCPSCPILHLDSNTTIVDKIQVMATCDKEECVPFWRVNASFINVRDPFVLGSADTVALRVEVINGGDSAHILRVTVDLPQNVRARTVPPVCDQSPQYNTWYCLAGLLIAENEKKAFDFNIELSEVTESILQVNASTQAFDSDNVTRAEAGLRVVRISRVDIAARAAPPIAVLSPDTSIGSPTIVVTHSYQAYCAGFTSVPRVRLNLIVPISVQQDNFWRKFVNFSVTGSLGEDNVDCKTTGLERRKRRAVNQPVERALSCGVGEVQCSMVVCEGGPLLPRSDGLNVILKMDVSVPVIGLFLDDSYQVLLTTSASAEILGEGSAVTSKAIATLFAGQLVEREDPLLPLYIALAVVAALALLALLVFILWKIGFFKRINTETIGEEVTALKTESGVESDAETVKK